MDKRPWLITAVLLCVICTIPLGVTGQNEQSWDTYQTTWTEIPYSNVTDSKIFIFHPLNGSLVAKGQKLGFIVVPFDADELLYTVDIFRNDILIYTCNQETVYAFDIYCTNPVNQIVTIKFKLNGETVLKLQYIATLSSPSLDADYTDQWLALQREKENESLSGKDVVSMKDKALSDINLVVTVGSLCIFFTIVAGLIVIIFKLISMVNAFSGIVIFISSFFYLDSMRKVDEAMRSISTATATDISIYYSSLAVLTLIFFFSILSYVIGYKIAKTRLNEWIFRGQNIKDRNETQYRTVIHKQRGEYYWMLQNSWDAFKRVVFGVKHKLIFDAGDISDTFHLIEAKNIPENNSPKRELRQMDKCLKSAFSKMAFITKPLESKEDQDKEDDKDDEDKDPKTDRKYNYEAWTFNEDGSLLKKDMPIIFLKGKPDPIEIYDEGDFKTIEEKMKEAREKAEKGMVEEQVEDVEKAWKGFHLFRKKKPKPKEHGMHIKLSNANNYDMLHYQNETDYLETLSDAYTKKDKYAHRLEIEMEVATTEKAKHKYQERDRQYKALRERMDQSGGNE